MNSANEQFTYHGNEQYPPGYPYTRPYHHPCVNPQEVQYTPHSNDMRVHEPLVVNTHLPQLGYGTVDREGVAINVGLTYTAGDRLYHGGQTPQDDEREWALLQPVQDFNYSSGQHSVGSPIMHNYAQHQNPIYAPYEEAAFQYTPDEFTNAIGPVPTYGAVTPLPIDPQLDSYSPAPFITPGPSATTPPSLVTPNTIHPPELTCDQCGSTKCNSQESLKRHKDREHGSNVPIYPCPVPGCPKAYSSKKETDVKRHIDTFHLNKRQYICSICSKTFSRKDNYRRHLKDKERRHDLTVGL